MRNFHARPLLALLAIFMGYAVAWAQVTPTAYWSWDTGFDSDIGNRVAISPTGVTTVSESVYGSGAVHFSGVGSGITIDRVDAIYDGSFTFATWLYLDSFNDETHIFGDWYGNSQHSHRLDLAGSANAVQIRNILRLPNEGTTTVNLFSNVTAATTFSTGEWAHVAIVWNQETGVFQQYVNGVATTHTTATTGDAAKLQKLSQYQDFGWKQDSPTDDTKRLHGSLDETYIYDTALSAAQLYGLYTRNDANYFPKYTASSIALENLNGSSKDMSLTQAVEQGVFGARAATTNLGIVGVRGGTYTGNPGDFANPVQNLVGDNGSFDLTNLGPGTGGTWGNGNENGTVGNLAADTFFIRSDATMRQSVTNGIGMHTNAFITYDVNELREAGGLGANQLMQFTAYGGVRADASSGTTDGKLNMAVILWDENYNVLGAYVNGEYAPTDGTSGTWSFNTNYLDTSQDNAATTCLTPAKSAFFDIAVTPDVSYISVVSAQGNGLGGNDHAILANPKLNIISPNTVWLNQLFGFEEGVTDKTRLYYANHQNDGVAAKASDGTLSYGVLKAEGNALAGGAVNLTGDNGASNAILFNAVALGPMTGAYGGIISNRCGGNADGIFDTAASDVLRDFNIAANGNYVVEGAIGMHADSLLTFDLDALRSLNGWGDATLTFNTDAAMAHAKTGENQSKAHALVLLSDDTSVIAAYLDGTDVTDLLTDLGGGVMGLTEDTALFNDLLLTGTDEPVNFNFDIMSDAMYLSLLGVAAGNLDTDHVMFLNPTLTAAMSDSGGVPEPATWGMLLTGAAAMLFFRRKRRAE